MKKLLILEHERHPTKGGISQQEAMDECPGNNLYISESYIYTSKLHIHRRFTYKGDTSTHAQGTDPRVALGA